MDARRANDRIAEKAGQLRFVSRVPMLCECSDPGCRTVVMIALDDYREIRRTRDAVLTRPGHRAEGAVVKTRAESYDIHHGGHGGGEGDGDRRSA